MDSIGSVERVMLFVEPQMLPQNVISAQHVEIVH